MVIVLIINCVIMADGVGSRFWPLSRSEKPKLSSRYLIIPRRNRRLLIVLMSRVGVSLLIML